MERRRIRATEPFTGEEELHHCGLITRAPNYIIVDWPDDTFLLGLALALTEINNIDEGDSFLCICCK